MRAAGIRAMILAAAVLAAASAGAQNAPQAITAREVHGGGDWKTDGKAHRGAQRWNLDVHRGDDNAIRGRITVADSPLLSTGNVEGKIDGRIISGTISDDDGNQIATFSGMISGTGMSGKYTDRTGEVGEWSWDGELPK